MSFWKRAKTKKQCFRRFGLFPKRLRYKNIPVCTHFYSPTSSDYLCARLWNNVGGYFWFLLPDELQQPTKDDVMNDANESMVKVRILFGSQRCARCGGEVLVSELIPDRLRADCRECGSIRIGQHPKLSYQELNECFCNVKELAEGMWSYGPPILSTDLDGCVIATAHIMLSAVWGEKMGV